MLRSHTKTIYQALGRGPVHSFPARMAPGIALDAVCGHDKPLHVLDPMMGSGTVLALARSKGHRATGIDIDPLAVMISRVWTTALNKDKLRDRAIAVLDQARRSFATTRVRDAYPRNADNETRKFVRYWFDDYARRQITCLAEEIENVPEHQIRDGLWCGLSRLIISKQSGASLAMDLSHSRPHKRFKRAPRKPFRAFVRAVDQVASNCIGSNQRSRGPATRTLEGDARRLPLSDSSIDLVLTSPPYLNAIDYIRCSKFSLVWMGYTVGELRHIRAQSVGAEIGTDSHDGLKTSKILDALELKPDLAAREKAILRRYVNDTRQALTEVARVLVPRGQAIYVVGENTVRGTFIRTSVIVSQLAQAAGLELRERHVRALPPNRRYLPPPTSAGGNAALEARMRRELVLSFIKM